MQTTLLSDDLNDLLNTINKISEETKINNTYIPSSLTILYGRDLELLGINYLYEALDIVPGMETMDNSSYSNIVAVRGNASILNPTREKIQYFINGQDFAENYLSNFPISLIERIEIQKGASITGYGKKGFVATINIVTKQNTSFDNEVNFSVGSFNQKGGTALFNDKINDWDVSVDTYYIKHNKKVDAPTGQFLELTSLGFPSVDRKKESLEGVKEKAIGLNFKNDNWNLGFRHIDKKDQNHYGFLGFLDSNEEAYTKFKITSAQVSYNNSVNENNHFEIQGGVLENKNEINTYFHKLEPNAFNFVNAHSILKYTDQTQYLKFKLRNESFDNHNIEYGINYTKESIKKNEYHTNSSSLGKIGFLSSGLYFPTSRDLTKLTGDHGVFKSPSNKNELAYYISDYYNLNSNMDISSEIRLDQNDGYKNRLNYKFAGVYTNDDKNIYKLIASSLYRSPSVNESSTVEHFAVYGNSELESEKVNTIEAVYTYKDSYQLINIGAFYSIYKNTIGLKTHNNGYKYFNNPEDQKNYGLEFEYSRNFNNRSKVLFNTSYIEYVYKNAQANINKVINPASSRLTSNLAYIYPLDSKTNLSTLVRYYGSKHTVKKDDIKSVVLTDINFSRDLTQNLKIAFAVKNIFDERYYYYGSQSTDEKMQREGRTWSLNVKYVF